MADDERRELDETDSSLALPSLRSVFRRRARRSPPAESAGSDTESAPTDAENTPRRRTTTRQMEAEPSEAEPVRRPRRRMRLHLPGPPAALLTGAVVGLALVGLTVGGLHLCSSMGGTDSCGKPGILILLAITAAAILLGSLLLRLTGVAAHGSTSFLGVGLLVVLVLLALLPVLDEWWVVIVVPASSMLTFLGSWWLTSTYAEPGERPH